MPASSASLAHPTAGRCRVNEITAEEYRKMFGLPPAGVLPEVMSAPNLGFHAMCDTIVIQFPFTIPRELSPNSTVPLRSKLSAKKRIGDLAALSCNSFIGQQVKPPLTIHWVVYLPKRGKLQDRNNILGGGLKRVQDEIVRAGIIEDDNPTILLDSTIEQHLWKDHGRAYPEVIAIIKHVDPPG